MKADDKAQKSSLTSLVRKNSLYILLERSLVPITNLLVTVYIVKKLTVNDYGLYNILFAILGYVALFSSFGLPNIFKRYIPEFNEKRQISNLKTLVGKGLFIRFVISIILVLFIFLFSSQIGQLFKLEQLSKYLLVFTIAIVFRLQATLLSYALTSLFLHKKYVTAQIIFVLLRAFLIFRFIKAGKGLVGLLAAESISLFSLFILLAIFYYKSMRNQNSEKKETFPTKRIIRFGGYDFFNEMGQLMLTKSTDYFVISAFLSPIEVGIYAFADRVTRYISHILPQSIFMDLIQPAFFTKYTKDEGKKSLDQNFNFLLKISAFFVVPVFIGIVVIGDKLIIHIFDPKYIDAHLVLIIFTGFLALSAFQFPTGLVVRSIERVEINLYSKIFAIYNLIGDLIVVKPFGIIGVALVTSSAVLFKNIFIYVLTRRHTHLKIFWIPILKIILHSLGMGIITYFAKPFITDIPSFIMIVLLGIAVYFSLSYFNKVFSDEERQIMNKVLPKPVFVF